MLHYPLFFPLKQEQAKYIALNIIQLTHPSNGVQAEFLFFAHAYFKLAVHSYHLINIYNYSGDSHEKRLFDGIGFYYR